MYLQTAFYLKVRLDGIMCCHIGADIGQCALVRIVHGRFWGFFFLCFFSILWKLLILMFVVGPLRVFVGYLGALFEDGSLGLMILFLVQGVSEIVSRCLGDASL